MKDWHVRIACRVLAWLVSCDMERPPPSYGPQAQHGTTLDWCEHGEFWVQEIPKRWENLVAHLHWYYDTWVCFEGRLRSFKIIWVRIWKLGHELLMSGISSEPRTPQHSLVRSEVDFRSGFCLNHRQRSFGLSFGREHSVFGGLNNHSWCQKLSKYIISRHLKTQHPFFC